MKYLSIILLLLTISCSKSDNTKDEVEPTPNPGTETPAVFPGATWAEIQTPEDVGFSSTKLATIAPIYNASQSSAFMVVYKGKILYKIGEVDFKYKCHSVRKSFLSALYGKAVKDEDINLDWTMADLAIDDNEGLTEIEKSATVRDLLKARSGIYHPALHETTGMVNRKPDRGEYLPGQYWYYNNWDFNALGTIYMNQTGRDFYEALVEDIAQPIQMENFSVSDGGYGIGDESRHKAYPFRMNAKDLARFGLLMLNKGKWKNTQLIPENWVTESTSYHSDAAASSSAGYGYMWWVQKNGNQYNMFRYATVPEGSYNASGVGGQLLLVIPQHDLIIVNRVNTDAGHSINDYDLGRMIKIVLDAKN